MAQLHQLQFQFRPMEDRLVLRIKTRDKSEFRFWLTRRFVKLLWPVLLRMLESNKQVQLQQDIRSKGAVLSFQHEKALSNSDFSQPYAEDAATTPLGEEPLLLTKIQIKGKPDGTPILCMHPAQGQGIELAMNEVLLHSFCKLLADWTKAAGWDLGLRVAPASPAAEEPPQRVN